jgi:hypothetical protein
MVSLTSLDDAVSSDHQHRDATCQSLKDLRPSVALERESASRQEQLQQEQSSEPASSSSPSPTPSPTPPQSPTNLEDETGDRQYFGWGMVKQWVLYCGAPTMYVTWRLTGSFVIGGFAIFALPAAALVQGAFHIIRFRISFGGSPLPHVPCSGVVKATTAAITKKQLTTTTTAAGDCAVSFTETTSSKSAEPESEGSTSSDSNMGSDKAPLRLLVIGDSLAIGVGQNKHSTPVLPEAIAKTLSKALGARPVVWTCYGAPGASAGWIVKELERSSSSKATCSSTPSCKTMLDACQNDSETETDESSSDGSSLDDDESSQRTGDDFKQLAWYKRLFKQPNMRKVDPNQQHLIGGPYDIAIVFTGGNDVKSAFFPFLLTGEAARLHQQARLRGGAYTEELRRILDVLNRQMRLRLQTLRNSVEAATENIRDYIIVRDGQQQHHHHLQQDSSDHTGDCSTSQDLSPGHSISTVRHDGEVSEKEVDHAQQLFPMVVLPGMPASALPVFGWGPLRWFALNIVGRMDAQKRKLARAHSGEVLFVNAPTVEDIASYQQQTGPYWGQKCTEETLWNVRDIPRRRARRIEADMKRHMMHCPNDEGCSHESHRKSHFAMFSPDQIHPTDEGYDFWGRYIANAIIQEWKESGKQVVDPLD